MYRKPNLLSLSGKSGNGRRLRRRRQRRIGQSGRRRKSARRGKARRMVERKTLRSGQVREQVETSRLRRSRNGGSSAGRNWCSGGQVKRVATRRMTKIALDQCRQRRRRLERVLSGQSHRTCSRPPYVSPASSKACCALCCRDLSTTLAHPSLTTTASRASSFSPIYPPRVPHAHTSRSTNK